MTKGNKYIRRKHKENKEGIKIINEAAVKRAHFGNKRLPVHNYTDRTFTVHLYHINLTNSGMLLFNVEMFVSEVSRVYYKKNRNAQRRPHLLIVPKATASRTNVTQDISCVTCLSCLQLRKTQGSFQRLTKRNKKRRGKIQYRHTIRLLFQATQYKLRQSQNSQDLNCLCSECERTPFSSWNASSILFLSFRHSLNHCPRNRTHFHPHYCLDRPHFR